MSKASELEDKRISNERIAARCRNFKDIHVADTTLNYIAATLLEEATHISEQRRKSWQSTSREYSTAGRILEQWARELTEHARPDTSYHRPPLTVEQMRAHPMSEPATQSGQIPVRTGDVLTTGGAGLQMMPLDEPVHVERGGMATLETRHAADGTLLGARIAEIASTDDKLDAAFGPLNPDPPELPPPSGMLGVPKTVLSLDNPSTDEIVVIANCNMNVFPPHFDDVETRNAPAPDFEFMAHLDGEAGFTPPRRTDTPEVLFVDPTAPIGVHAQQRMTFAEVREHGMARQRGTDHRSHSQVTSYQECGVRYALDDMDQVPAWWNVGGTAVHYACEMINQHMYQIPDASELPVSQTGIAELWETSFGRAISEAVATPGAGSPNDWRAAKKGAEGYDWWRVEGAAMVGRWVDRLRRLYAEGWRIATIDDRPAIEISLPFTILAAVDQHHGNVKVENIVDLIMTNDAGDFLIVDMKSSASMPDSTRQLGQYGWALSYSSAFTAGDIFGAYWMARDDGFIYAHASMDLRELHPWDEIEYLISTMDASERQGLYLPNKSKSDRFGCGSCPVRGLCPVGPRA